MLIHQRLALTNLIQTTKYNYSYQQWRPMTGRNPLQEWGDNTHQTGFLRL